MGLAAVPLTLLADVWEVEDGGECFDGVLKDTRSSSPVLILCWVEVKEDVDRVDDGVDNVGEVEGED